MNQETQGKLAKSEAIELVLARLLRLGSVIAAALLGTGLSLMLLGMTDFGPRLVSAGLVVLLCTPILRVVAAGVIFVRERDWYFALFCLVVLCALALGVFLGRSA